MRDITVFSGSAHRELAQEICDHLGTPLHPVQISRFANDVEGDQGIEISRMQQMLAELGS